MKTFRISHSTDAAVAYITLREGDYFRTEEASKDVLIDRDVDGNILGIELVGIAAPVLWDGRPVPRRGDPVTETA